MLSDMVDKLRQEKIDNMNKIEDRKVNYRKELLAQLEEKKKIRISEIEDHGKITKHKHHNSSDIISDDEEI